MRLGYLILPLHPPGADPGQTLADDLDQIVTLDRFGFDEVWVGEHFTARWENIPCPDLLIAQALGLTSRVVFGTGVSCLPNHHPVMLAHRIAQLDQMARGRLIWGVGSGAFGGDLDLFDVDGRAREQRQLTRDVLDAVLELWADPAPGLREDRRWRYRLPGALPADDDGHAPAIHFRPYQRPHPPIAVAGIGPRSDMLSLAGERGWMPMSTMFVPVATLQAHWETYAESAERAGRRPDRALWRIARDVYVGATPEAARREAIEGALGRDWRDYWLPSLRRGNMLFTLKEDQSLPDEAITLDYLCEHLWIVGDAAEVTEKLRRLDEAVGGFGGLQVIAHEWAPDAPWRRGMEALAREVMPRLAAMRAAEGVAP
jgi:alkanesulfonate monooxygenase SsuD/methylene tetrahydromethanopterin reductase-like flavin-dependent oxidoreductase (luciferase family)